MNNVILIAVILAGCFLLGFLALALIRRLSKKPMKRHTYVLLSLALSFALCIGAGLIYLNIHYSADQTAVQAMASADGVTVTETDGSIFFDGAGEETALIFYPGAKVDAEAYAPLMKRIAAGGVDCFAVKLPFRMAFFNMNAADNVIKNNKYEHYILSGHSLGGVAAASYAANHSDSVDGVALLASYPTQQLDDSVTLLSVYGTNDGVLNKAAYEEAKKYYPKNSAEQIIKGGNHAYFGNYGEQDGDNPADITAEEQQKQTAEAILALAGI